MKRRLWLLVLLLCSISVSNLAFGQSSSNKGKDFYLAYSAHIDALNSRLTLILSADVQTNYSVFIGNTVIATGTINANTSQQEVINPNSYSVYIGSEGKELNKAIHITTDKSISLYVIMSNKSRTGGSMILPTNTLGKDYYAFSYQNSGSQIGYSQFTILATKDGTDVDITPTQTSRNGAHVANTTYSIQLNKGDIYQYQATNDLTGSYITSVGDCKPIAVFSGNTWVAFCENGNAQRDPSGGDNLYQQIFPISSWGKNFVTAPFYNTLHGNTDAFKIIVSENNTFVTVNGSVTDANGTSLNNPYAKGSVIEFFSTAPNVVSATKPIALAHYQTSQNCNPNNPNNTNVAYPGDPEITLLNPIEQTLNDITVFSKLNSLSSVKTNINAYYINVIIKTANVSTFKMDGVGYASSFIEIDNSQYSYAIIDVTNLQAQHRLISDGGFSAIAYGYGNYESYAYLAGANIKSFTFQTSNLNDQSIMSGCTDEAFKLKINLTAPVSEIIWDLGEGFNKTINNPIHEETIKDGVTYYTYTYLGNVTYTTPGDHDFKVKVTYLNTTNCGNFEEIENNFTIFKQPKAAFDTGTFGCEKSKTQFNDDSFPDDANLENAQWFWDFGDENAVGDEKTSTEQNPGHVYSKPGKYLVTLRVKLGPGCSSDVQHEVTIYPVPVAKFQAAEISCIGTEVVFNDQSDNATIGSWKWNFDDGSNGPEMFEKNPVHTFTKTGEFNVTLSVTGAGGCQSNEVSHKIIIVEKPVANFDDPGSYCVDDREVIFKSTSKDIDGTSSKLSYKWAFNGNGGAQTSDDKDAKFTFSSEGIYSVSLTITNALGCTGSKDFLFTVNSKVKTGNFLVPNPLHLCSNTNVVVNNPFSIEIGKISRIEIYKDYENLKTDPIVVENPDGEDLSIPYASFGGKKTENYNIVVRAYYGQKCYKEVSQTITLNPSPQLEFNLIPKICVDEGVVLINQAKETSGLLGKGIYSGTGIDADGNFNANVAGPGVHIITYTFNADNGCKNSIQQTVTVFASPTIVLPPKLFVLAGGYLTLPATAMGDNLTYKWYPSTFLNHDDVLNPVITPTQDTEYTLVVNSSDGCPATAKIFVKVLENLDVPNAFSPNGDGVNDVWNIKYLESYPNTTVEVFNREGARVFFSNGYKLPFDGTYKGATLPVGVYYYIINPRNGRKVVSGPVTIIR